MSTDNRPLSPHLSIYSKQLTSVLSISHRITGIVLSAGALLLSIWLVALASGPESYTRANAIIGSIPGQLVLFAFTAALYYHLCNGIRHLFWDAGHGFELDTVYMSGKAAVGVSLALTVITWGIALASGGSAA